MIATEASARADDVAARTRGVAAAVPTWVWLSSLVGLSVIVRYLLGRGDPGPWIFVDEIIYSDLAKSVGSGEFAVRDVATGAYGYVYPLLVSPAFILFDSVPSAFEAAKVINAILMSLTAVPAYFLGRRIVGRPWALLGAALVVAIPALTYTSVLMTENAFYPLFTGAALLMVLSLEKPTLVRQLGVFVLIGAAFYTRTQAAALVPAYVVAILAFTGLEARSERDRLWSRASLRRVLAYRVSWALLALSVVAFVVLQVGRGESASSSLGAYSSVVDSERLNVRQILRWFVYHLAELDLWLGVIPVVAMFVLVGVAWSRDRTTRPLRAFAATATPVVVMFAIIVAMFNTSIANTRIEERNFFYVGALFLIALAWWVGDGLPRPRAPIIAGVIVAVILPGVIPYGSFINLSAVSDTFGLLPLWGFQQRYALSFAELTIVVVVVAILAGIVTLAVPRRAALLLPALVLVYFAAAHAPIDGRTQRAAEGAVGEGVRVSPGWVDDAVGSDAEVAFVWSGGSPIQTVWVNEFFNRSIGPVYNLGSPTPGGLPEVTLAADPSDGQLLDPSGQPVSAQYALTDQATRLVGEEVAADPGRGMILYRVDGPLTISDQVQGVYVDTWTGPEAFYTRNGCAGGSVTVIVSSDPGLFTTTQTIVAFEGAAEVARITIDPAGEPQRFVVPLTSEDGRCTVRFAVTPTAVPDQVVGGGDPRELGVHMVGFFFSPGGAA